MMKALPSIFLCLSPLLGCQKQDSIVPDSLTTGRILKTENTFDSKGQNQRTRWVIDISPVSLEGNWSGHSYTQAKVFNLPDTANYRIGRTISFHYQLVPTAQQTPWKTVFEWDNARPTPSGAEPFAELSLSEVKLISSSN